MNAYTILFAFLCWGSCSAALLLVLLPLMAANHKPYRPPESLHE